MNFLQELHFLFKKFSNVQNKTVNGKSGVGGVWMDCIKRRMMSWLLMSLFGIKHNKSFHSEAELQYS